MIKDKIREWLGITDFEANTNSRFNIQSTWLTSGDTKREELAKLTDAAFKEQIEELDLIWEGLEKIEHTVFSDAVNKELKTLIAADKTKGKTKKPRAEK